ncbi:MAG: hypothetical protein P3W87_007500 [Gammaproteobacteria bacterium]|nr:hypothetical protein [Gammaproteobacteria bacterium]
MRVKNSHADMAKVMSNMASMAVATGAAVLYLHHVSKTSALKNQVDTLYAARGASVLVDHAQWCAYLAPMSEHEAKQATDSRGRPPIGEARRRLFVRFGVSKSSVDTIQPDRWFQRMDGGVLRPVDLIPAQKASAVGLRFAKGGLWAQL